MIATQLSLEEMKASEGIDPVLIAMRLQRYPNSGNTIDCRKLADAVLGLSCQNHGEGDAAPVPFHAVGLALDGDDQENQ